MSHPEHSKVSHCCSHPPAKAPPRGTPTVIPSQFFVPHEDAEVLRKAMKGFGTNEKAIINILTKRSSAQRLEIKNQFKKLHNSDLIKLLKSEISGNFQNSVVALMTPLPEFYADELHRAIDGVGTKEHILIEVLATLSNWEIAAIKRAYHEKYKKTLETDIKGDTSGYFQRLLVSLCSAARDETLVTDLEMARNSAKSDAASLYKAGEKRWGTDESTFNRILCYRSYPQLRLIFEEYEHLTGHGIEKAIEKEFSGNVKSGLLAIVESVKNRSSFFAKKLHTSMKGLGTKDLDLIRLIVTRSEIDLGDIKREYEVLYSKSLASAIKGDCSGDYQKCLLALIGEY